ncbi:MAG TPA: DNA polymerase III subunit delta' [Syntrophaceae bacterium]|nr:DNA polymerase III subunit delta' [Syntrophaceae bacterium]
MPFKDIIGQDRAIGFLKNAIRKDRLAHAYLFTGIDGIGKRTTAINLAMVVNCLLPKDWDSCGECLSCRKIQRGNHPDVQIIEPDGQFIRIEQVRELSRSLYFRPIEGKKKVCIIANGEKMQHTAANALLKTLEEPPSHILIVITAPESKDLLPTMVSRCQNIGFNPLAPAIITKRLCEERGLDRRTAHILSFLAEGSLGRALSMDSQSLLEKREYLINEVCNISFREAGKISTFAEAMGKSTDDLLDTLEILKSLIRDIMVLKNAKEGVCPIIHIDCMDKIRDWCKRFSSARLFEIFTTINEAKKAINRNVNRVLVLETMLLTISRGEVRNYA